MPFLGAYTVQIGGDLVINVIVMDIIATSD